MASLEIRFGVVYRQNDDRQIVTMRRTLAALRRGFSAFSKATTFEGKIAVAFLVVSIIVVLLALARDARTNYKTPAEHLRLAKDLCHVVSSGIVACVEADAQEAIRHLDQIPPSVPEYAEASKIRSLIQEYREKQSRADIARLKGQSEEESRQQMLRNIRGEAHDTFYCLSTAPKVSFDYGHYWWPDDGRCAAELQAERKLSERPAAESSSNWPTTLRVETDIDTSWLQNEERTCRTYPDAHGFVAR